MLDLESVFFRLMRFNIDGTFDATFGSGGIAYINSSLLSETPENIMVKPDGKILVNCSTYDEITGTV
jgi:hypothetical protein